MSSTPCIIEIEGLWTRYGERVINQDINLCILTGEIFALVGGSGSGKTTLLRHMLGLETSPQGTVSVFGKPLHVGDTQDLRELRNRWGVLFQAGALFSALNVFDNVALPLRELRVLDEPSIRELVMLKLDMVQIDAKDTNKMPAELSGGMIKRVALARALALEPELLFLDEPTAGLDPELSDSFVALIQKLRAELTLTVVIVTHDLDTLLALADRVAVLANQRIIALGPLNEVRQFKHPFIRKFFGGRMQDGDPPA